MKKILVIEDNEDIRENIAEILELASYHVLTAENGRKGAEMAIAHHPDLILCDILMPELDGYGVLHLLQKHPEMKRTPFIFLSAKTEQSEIRTGMNLGADDYIPKPFSATDLMNAIDSRLKKAESIRQELAEWEEEKRTHKGELSRKDELMAFTEGRNINRYKKKQTIYTEGNHPIYLFYVLKGKVKVYKTNEDGKELMLNLCTEGDFLGYTALLEASAYKDSAEAIEDCEIAVIPKKDFEELMNRNSEVAREFIRHLAKDVTEKEQQLLNIAYNSLRKKVADALMVLQQKYQKKNGGDLPAIDISRENLATIAGTATESLIRTLSDFKNEKLIDIHDGKITILDEKRLKQIVG